MKRWLFFPLLLVCFVFAADAATPVQRRAQSVGTTRSARSVITQRGGGSATSASPMAVSARSAVRAPTAKPAAPVATTKTPAVVARAATKKVISVGTKVSTAADNIVVSEKCRLKYNGCLDSFCMLENVTGGRCICSNRNAKLDELAKEIEELDKRSYQMVTAGVEKLEMGEEDTATVMNRVDSVLDSLDEEEEERTSKNAALDLSLWNKEVESGEDEIFDEEEFDANSLQAMIQGKTGDNLHVIASKFCIAQMPECKSETDLLRLMYARQIESDCAAYENSLKQQRNASEQKLATAEKALRESALNKLKTENKYDLGQCVTEFKNCMITTADCGKDFSKCAVVAASDNTNSKSQTPVPYTIMGKTTSIDISRSTYDALFAKKPLCDHVTKSCVKYADQVWGAFLKEAAPQLKNAELIAEDKIRQDCIGNISACFQKACKDTMDPNDPDGSYDMCLTHPETMLNVCKIPLNACGVSEKPEMAENSAIWEFVEARLAAMRVNSCTKEVKDCLTSADRCGKDYSQCFGLDTDTIIGMCPPEKLIGCQKDYGDGNGLKDPEKVYDDLENMVAGIMLNIDNAMLTECQKAVDEAMIRLCGDADDCSDLVIDKGLGSNTLDYQICKFKDPNTLDSAAGKSSECYRDQAQIPDSVLGRVGLKGAPSMQAALEGGDMANYQGIIYGQIPWDAVTSTVDGTRVTIGVNTKAISDTMPGVISDIIDPNKLTSKINSELKALASNINLAIDSINTDQKVAYCLNGRDLNGKETEGAGRFPNIASAKYAIIAGKALAKARDNYYKKYDELRDKQATDAVTIGARVAKNLQANVDDVKAKRDVARSECNKYNTGEETVITRNDLHTKIVRSAFGEDDLHCDVITTTKTCTNIKGKHKKNGKQVCGKDDWSVKSYKKTINFVDGTITQGEEQPGEEAELGGGAIPKPKPTIIPIII